MTQYRQGDLLIEKIPARQFSQYAARVENRVLAYGEVTGHSHRLAGGDLWQDRGEMIAVLDAPTDLIHEEHATITLPEGTYRVIRQREYLGKDETAYVND